MALPLSLLRTLRHFECFLFGCGVASLWRSQAEKERKVKSIP